MTSHKMTLIHKKTLEEENGWNLRKNPGLLNYSAMNSTEEKVYMLLIYMNVNKFPLTSF